MNPPQQDTNVRNRTLASMGHAFPGRAGTLQVLETLAIGTIGGVLFLLIGLPGGLISGSMMAVGIAAMMGRSLAMPPILTQAVLVLLGISLGSLMSRQLLQHVGAYPLTIALLAIATFLTTFCISTRSSSARTICPASCSSPSQPPASSICSGGSRKTS